MTTKAHNQRCAGCGGKLEATTITSGGKRGTHIDLLQHGPAHVCTACRRLGVMRKCCKSLTG
jgi:hypothetical protein